MYNAARIAGMRHQRIKPGDNLYAIARRTLGITQSEAARRLGINHKAWGYRERTKVMYWPVEIVALKDIMGATSDEIIEMLKACL